MLRYASAGHPPMLLVSPEGKTTWLEGGRSQPLYGEPGIERPEASVVLEAGSLLLLYSDGLVERRGERIASGLRRLEQLAKDLHELPVDDICERVLAEARAGSDQIDDVVLVGLRRLPVRANAFHRAFPARPEELRNARAAMRSWLAEQQVDAAEQHDLLLTVGEACSNAVEHAYHGTTRRGGGRDREDGRRPRRACARLRPLARGVAGQGPGPRQGDHRAPQRRDVRRDRPRRDDGHDPPASERNARRPARGRVFSARRRELDARRFT